MSGIPEFYTIVNGLIAEIAKERGENPKELKDKLVRKIEEEKRAGAASSQAQASPSLANTLQGGKR